ncbi:hypothetical protein DSO57_1006356 [Entomophthora muscae]|uniref:Uncharacterized protein n=1 Tax=Entomophthora muscae TaxID=34485 RepID=A0ACC2U5Q3_9FUNG|nr:hypothetical protein DSO57_1006356 [Entomophthora muscae]
MRYFLSSHLETYHLQILSRVFKTNFFDSYSRSVVILIKPQANYRKAVNQLILKTESLKGSFLDLLLVVERLIEFGVWKLTVHAGQIQIWFPRPFGPSSIRQFLCSIGVHQTAASLNLGLLSYADIEQHEEGAFNISGSEVSDVTVSPSPYRQELYDFLENINRGRLSFGH